MYNNNNNGKYLIHYGRKGMKWGQNIFTQGDLVNKLHRRKRIGKKSLKRSSATRAQLFANKVRAGRHRIKNILNKSGKMSVRDIPRSSLSSTHMVAQREAYRMHLQNVELHNQTMHNTQIQNMHHTTHMHMMGMM